ncbi:MAG TPA: DCC1-like thiol-disulfide oxidoreductase family protein [Acidimicrobiales bacterium]|nr:DCC1-like thiol-disulfide oxidoreductase family protein [Acidimicrobiales bacterium]
MTRSVPPPVLLFDGDCAFCSTCARWLAARIPMPVAVEPWQWTDLEPLGVAVEEVDAAVVLVDVDLHRTHGPDALAGLLRSSTSGAWRACGRVLGLRPVRALAWPTYRWISRNRHRMPGGTAQCSLPQAERHT